jgi:transcription initiation factor TFIIE subunit alpha
MFKSRKTTSKAARKKSGKVFSGLACGKSSARTAPKMSVMNAPKTNPQYGKSRFGVKAVLTKAQQIKKTSNPEIQVKRTVYSRGLRSAVLTSAAARQRLIEIGGENTINIIRDFDKDMSDEELARSTNIKASDVRVVLNRLHSYGLFSYTRVRDRDSGWYSYIWRMSEGKLKEFSDGKEREVGERSFDLDGDKYRCMRCSPGEYVEFESAMDAQFRCCKCGSELEFLERKRSR